MVRHAYPFVQPRRWWIAGCFLLMALIAGCNPGAISMLLLPFSDDKLPPKCKLAKKKEETTVLVYATVPKGAVPLDLESVPNDLCDVLSVQLRKRFTANKEKVVVVNPAKVRSFLNNRLGKPIDEIEMGEQFKADYVVRLDIASMALYEPKTRMLFRGHTEINVTAIDMKQQEGENRIFSEIYRTAYPSSGPIDAGGASASQFRGMFLNKIGRDVSRFFAAYPMDERMAMD